jgi:pSer/pThr/pTyr-binding forkhead associated (FHA) protein
MQMRFINTEGRQMLAQLGTRPLVIGRGKEADLILDDKAVSRTHAEIRNWDGDFVIKDLNSSNGTQVNGKSVAVALLKAGDTVGIGPVTFHFEKGVQKGSRTIIQEISAEMQRGKGYKTLLGEMVQQADARPQSDEP